MNDPASLVSVMAIVAFVAWVAGLWMGGNARATYFMRCACQFREEAQRLADENMLLRAERDTAGEEWKQS